MLPVLLAMLLGIIDFAMLGRQSQAIANAAREGARAAAVGQSAARVRTRVINAASPPLSVSGTAITNGSITLDQAPVSATPSYTSWPADVGDQNSVVTGNYVRVTVSYNHRSFTGAFNRTVTIPVVMRREG